MTPKVSIIILNWSGWKGMGDEWMLRAKGKRQKARGERLMGKGC